jgi:hypothetical protein
VAGDTGEHFGEPGARIHIVQRRGGDERVHHRGPLAAAVTACEQPCLSAEGHAAERAFGRVARQTNAAIAEEFGERGPALEGVVQRPGQQGGRSCPPGDSTSTGSANTGASGARRGARAACGLARWATTTSARRTVAAPGTVQPS